MAGADILHEAHHAPARAAGDLSGPHLYFQRSYSGAADAYFDCRMADQYAQHPSASPLRFYVRARDQAGNVDPTPAMHEFFVRTDTTRPVVTPQLTGILGDNGWYIGDVLLRWLIDDPETPVVRGEGCGDRSFLVDTVEVAQSCRATSYAGETWNVTTVKRDTTAPTISASATTQPNAAGWYNQSPTVQYVCNDNVSGIAANGCPLPRSLHQEGAAVSAPALTATDNAGNVSQPSNVVTVRIDRTAPVLSATMPPGQLFLNAVHDFELDATDALSGVASRSCGAMDTGTVGTRSVTCTATDRAGNSVSRSATYRVIYDVVPLSAPLSNPGQLYVVEAPRSVPFEWRVRDANGVAIANATLIQTAATAIACPDTGIPLPTPPAGETNTFENFGDGRYRRNWWINATQPISCVRLDVVLNDGIARSAMVRIVPKIRRTGGPGQPVPQATPVSRPMSASQRVPRVHQPVQRGVKPAKPRARRGAG